MVGALLPFPALPPRKPRRVRVAPDEPREPREERPTLPRLRLVVAAVLAGRMGSLSVEQDREIRVLSLGRSRAWLTAEGGEYLLRWPRLALRRSFWTCSTAAELRRGLVAILEGRSPDGRCLQLGCEWCDQHLGPHSEGAVTRLLGDRQLQLPWGT